MPHLPGAEEPLRPVNMRDFDIVMTFKLMLELQFDLAKMVYGVFMTSNNIGWT